ncbi:hypothetical protein CYLTODRAFT_390789 [Cylindrobasidium torrendii FP15055 ss-10]|uniref:CwfJ C-terminus 1-domain-containing protein-like protein n=1 Tax=Cylindrobasidium torrendii FP15055 ss-10 TaxID=1314674 RepID=A0A0D7BKY5_9AGAR|nr:hypothetical protein CYLTODRAFT_390789 [Cylindrobasidium torrendii FP15055 ss-10]
MWVEKNIDMDGEKNVVQDIPTSDSLKLQSNASGSTSGLKREDWMLDPTAEVHRAALEVDDSLTEGYGETSTGNRTVGGGVDFFSSLGTEKKKKPQTNKPNPDFPVISSRELNLELKEGKALEPTEESSKPKIVPGGPGSQWRMTRLRRVFETAEEDGLPVEQVALDRFGSLEAFEEAKEERRILDERDGNRSVAPERGRPSSSVGSSGGERSMMFNDANMSGMSSRSASFRRPGASQTGPSTPTPSMRPPVARRVDHLRGVSQTGSPLPAARTPIPSALTPQSGGSGGGRSLSPSSLNKLQAKVLRAKLMGDPNADALEAEYDAASKASLNGGDVSGNVRTRVEVLPTMDGHGRLYDVGHGKDDGQVLPGNRKKKEKVETRDPKTGELVRINADDDETSLGEMLRQEKFGAGMADQKDMDAQFAKAIMGDGKFKNDLDYMDDNLEKLSRQKMRSDAMKRQFAINDYKKTQQVLSTCQYCFGEDDSPPKAAVVAMGSLSYLACTSHEELVDGHCFILPIQHHLSMLEADDEVWDEVRNFMKCLMRMFAEEDKGIIFYETITSLKKQRHTYIECVPLPWDVYDTMPGYFKESILTSEGEWSQHRKLIDFAQRPFRRAMVPNLPYFMVQFDYKGDKGYGHVIEGVEKQDEEDETAGLRDQGKGEFPSYFAGEIIGNVLEVEPRLWRRPRKIDARMNADRVGKFKKKYAPFDWTGMLR